MPKHETFFYSLNMELDRDQDLKYISHSRTSLYCCVQKKSKNNQHRLDLLQASCFQVSFIIQLYLDATHTTRRV